MIFAAAAASSFHIGLLVTAYGLGFRHGIDWDHIAAITDITGSQEDGRQSVVLATMYVLGHALVVLALGVAAIVLAEQLPDSVDAVMERVVGATLVVLGVYVIVSLLRHGRDFRMKSRWMLVFSGVRRGVRWVRRRRTDDPLVVVTHEHAHDPSEPHPDVHQEMRVAVGASAHALAPMATEHRHGHRHIGSLPDDPFDQYGKPTAFGVGMLHGVGAETPTQVLLFLAAAGAGGEVQGLLLLACFVVGLITSNTVITAATTFGFLNASRNWHIYLSVSVITALFSLIVGLLFLTGSGSVLPAFFAGRRAAGGRITSARRATVSALLAHDSHPTAEDLASAVQAQHPDVHQTTIYRILDDLEKLGIVEHTHLGHGPAVYHLAESAHPHVVCERCGKIIPVDRAAFNALAKQLLTKHDFVIRPCHYTVTGRCRACAD